MTAKLRAARRTLAENCANAVLRQHQVTGLRVDPQAIAEAKDIMVQAKPDTSAGVSGMLIKAGDAFGILYATHIPNRGFQRFSIAHELGHYCLEGHPEALLESGMHQSHAGFVSDDPYEQEADHFAAALLMPETPFKREVARLDAGLACVDALRVACETSMMATAIRYSALTRDAVAVICSTGPAIDWCFMSDALKQVKGLRWLRKGTPVPRRTITAEFNAKPENVRTGGRAAGDGNLDEWMDGERNHRIVEEVVGLGQYGRTLSVLTCRGLGEHAELIEDEDDEEAMIESWTPRFRR